MAKEEGGEVAGNARKEIEQETGKSVITDKNATQLNRLVVGLIEGTTDDNSQE